MRLSLPRAPKIVVLLSLFSLSYGFTDSISKMGILPDGSSWLIQQALENQFRGNLTAEILLIRESLFRGMDSLVGHMQFNDPVGARDIQISGRAERYSWWSRNFGQEQWWKDEQTQRGHRIPNRSLRKPAFASLLSFEDLANLPVDFLAGYQSSRMLGGTDSTFELSLILKPELTSRYAYMDVILQKSPILLKSVTFFSQNGQRLKSMEVMDYRVVSLGKYSPTGFHLISGDSLLSVQLSLKNLQTIEPARVKIDNTSTQQAEIIAKIRKRFMGGLKLEAAKGEDTLE